MDQNKYFSLFACCFPVSGKKKGIILDSQRGAFLPIPNLLIPILKQSKEYCIRELVCDKYPHLEKGILSYFSKLIEMEYGFLTSEPERFPEMDLTWKSPYRLSVAIIEYSSIMSDYDLPSLFAMLAEEACEMIQLRLFGQVEIGEINQALQVLNRSRIKRCEILMNEESYTPQETEYTQIANNHPRVSNYLIFNSDPKYNTKTIHHYRSPLKPASYFEKITKDGFVASVNTFAESQEYNIGLHRKVGIDLEGYIKNHPAHSKEFGNLRTGLPLSKILRDPGFLEQQLIPKSAVYPCKECQYRNMCGTVSELLPEKDSFTLAHPCDFDPAANAWNNPAHFEIET